ncbi:retrotransposon protein, putative, ty1-copia subclass [Tanacetum coccineum]
MIHLKYAVWDVVHTPYRAHTTKDFLKQFPSQDFIILDIPEDDDVPLILGRPFLSTAHSKIDVYKIKTTLRVGEIELVFKSIKPATSIIRIMLKDLDSKTKLIGEDNESFDPLYEEDRYGWQYTTYKARLIAKGFTQTYGVDYEETFSPVADIKAIRILIAIAAYYDYEIWKMDVKFAFLNGRLNEDVYMVQPEGFVNPKHPRRVCKIQRSIYGLKQASKSWNKRFDEEIKRYGFTQYPDKPCVYKRASGSIVVFLILYVDDILLMGNNIPMLQDVKSWLGKCFTMKELGEAAYILGIKIYQDRSRWLIGLSQNAYIDKILKRFKMYASKCGTIPLQPNVDLSKTQGPSTPEDVIRMKGIPYASAVGSIIWETDRDDLRSQTGYVFVMNGGAVNWKSSKRSTATMSSIKVEYIAAAEAAMEAIWIRKFIYGLGVVPNNDRPMDMYCDNTGSISIADEPGVQKGAKHFRQKYHFIREVIQEGDIRIRKVHTDNNLADPLIFV